MHKSLKPIFWIALLSGCSTASVIQPINQSESEFSNAIFSGETHIIAQPTPNEPQYRVFHQAASGFVPLYAIRTSAEKRAVEFCKRKDKSLNVIQETTSTPPHILGNFPRVELVFECLAKKIAY